MAVRDAILDRTVWASSPHAPYVDATRAPRGVLPRKKGKKGSFFAKKKEKRKVFIHKKKEKRNFYLEKRKFYREKKGKKEVLARKTDFFP